MGKRRTDIKPSEAAAGFLIAAGGGMICVSYLCAVYLPEAGSVTPLLLPVVFAALFSLSYRVFGRGWQAAALCAAALVLSLLSPSVRETLYVLPDVVSAKADIIAENITYYYPDYSLAYYVWEQLPVYGLLTAFLSVPYAWVFTHALFGSEKYAYPFALTALTAVVAFIGKERQSGAYIACAAAFMLVLWSLSVKYRRKRASAKASHVRRGYKRCAVLMLALLVMGGALTYFEKSVTESSEKAAELLGVNEWKNILLGHTAPGDTSGGEGGSSYIYLPIDSGEYTYVSNRGVFPTDTVLFYSNLPWYNGTAYLEANVYDSYESDIGRWSSTVEDATLYSPTSGLITANGVKGTLARVAGGAAFPKYLYSERENDFLTVAVRDGMSYEAQTFKCYIPYPPTSAGYIGMIEKAMAASDELFTDSTPQYYDSDVDFNALAKEILAGYPYTGGNDTVRAIYAVRKYLSGMTYTLEPRKGANYSRYDSDKSYIYNFIYNTKEGYCVHYATSAVLLFRAMGIKARYATGYSFDSAQGSYCDITDRNAHAWPEIFIPSLGWVPVEVTISETADPSPETVSEVEQSEEASSSQPQPEHSAVTSSNAVSETPAVSDDTPGSGVGSIAVAVTAAFSVLALIAYIAFTVRLGLIRGRRRRELYDAAAGGMPEGGREKAVKSLWRSAVMLLGILGTELRTGEQAEAFAARADAAYPDIPPLTPVIGLFLAAEFGGETDEAAAEACGRYLIRLNDFVYGRISLPKRLFGVLKGSIVASGDKKSQKNR